MSETDGLAENLRRVCTRMGIPPSSVNCFDGADFLLLALGTGAIRVPSPAAGMIAMTFIGAISIQRSHGHDGRRIRLLLASRPSNGQGPSCPILLSS
jgi:hypothetical protein